MSSSQIPMLGIGNGSSRLGIGNVGVQTKFVAVIGNGGVRDKFEALNRKWRSSSQISMLGIGNGGVQP